MGSRNSSHCKLKKADISDLTEHTYFTDDEVKRWHQLFIKDCPTGQLRKEEFQAIYRKVFPNGDPTRFAGFVFNVFDKDLDGTISFVEFLMALSITSRGNMDEKLDWAFNLYDIDRDGHITRDEMVEIISAIFEMVGPVPESEFVAPRTKADHIFDKMDFNKDGFLTADEFRSGAKQDPWIVRALTLDPTIRHP